ncbi:Porin [Gammaproteobacteria bacterium]
MNKKFLTVAISAALAGPTAALADVTVYGQLHMSIDYTDSKTKAGAGSSARKTNLGISSNASRIGFKGNEDIGSGMKAVWQIESLVNMDGGTGGLGGSGTTLATRNTYLGLAGGFGTFLMGRHDTPFKMLGRSLDPFIDTIADNRQLLATDFGELRPSNVIAYITPSFSGFSAVLAYVTGLNNSPYTDNFANAGIGGADNNKATAFSMNATYKNGPIYAGLAYEKHNLINTVAAPNDPSAWRLGGSYTFGPATVGGMWEQLSDVDSKDMERTAGTLFGTYTFGMETVKLAYTQAGKWKTGGNDLKNSDASLWSLGVDHKFSKRTTAYAQYTGLNNEKAADYALGGGTGLPSGGGGYGDPVQPSLGKDPNAFSVGLIHKF